MLQRLVGAGIAAVQGSRAACCGGMLQLHQQASCSALERTQTAGCGRGAAVRLQQVHMHAAAMQHALQQRCQTAPSPDALSGMFFAPYKALLVDAAGARVLLARMCALTSPHCTPMVLASVPCIPTTSRCVCSPCAERVLESIHTRSGTPPPYTRPSRSRSRSRATRVHRPPLARVQARCWCPGSARLTSTCGTAASTTCS
jgi:hypothetical protein